MLTRIQIAAITKVRVLLRGLQTLADRKNHEQESYELGKFAEACEQADNALFNVVNINSSYFDEEGGEELAQGDLGEIPLTR